jgi:hypothetical protein
MDKARLTGHSRTLPHPSTTEKTESRGSHPLRSRRAKITQIIQLNRFFRLIFDYSQFFEGLSPFSGCDTLAL